MGAESQPLGLVFSRHIAISTDLSAEVTLRQGPCDGNGTAPATVVTQFDKQRLAAVEVSLFTAKGRSGSVTPGVQRWMLDFYSFIAGEV